MFFEDSVEVNAVVDDCSSEARTGEMGPEMLFEGFAADTEVRHGFLAVEAALDGHDCPGPSAAARVPSSRCTL